MMGPQQAAKGRGHIGAAIGHHVFDVDHPGDLVESFAVDRQTGMGGLDHLIGDFGQRGIFLDRDDIGARLSNTAIRRVPSFALR